MLLEILVVSGSGIASFTAGWFYNRWRRSKKMAEIGLRRMDPTYREDVRWAVTFTPPGGQPRVYHVKDINEVPEDIREIVRQSYIDWASRYLQFLGMMGARANLGFIDASAKSESAIPFKPFEPQLKDGQEVSAPLPTSRDEKFAKKFESEKVVLVPRKVGRAG